VKPDTCPFCDHKTLYKNKYKLKPTIDLKFTSSGIKRWVIQYEAGWFRCASCLKVFNTSRPSIRSKYGRNLMIWSVNQNITYNVSFENISKIIKEQFRINVWGTTIVRFRAIIAKEYNSVYQS